MQLSQSQNTMQQLQAQFSQEQQRLTQEIEELEEEHQQRHKSMKEAHILAFQSMEETKEQEQKVCSMGIGNITHFQMKGHKKRNMNIILIKYLIFILNIQETLTYFCLQNQTRNLSQNQTSLLSSI